MHEHSIAETFATVLAALVWALPGDAGEGGPDGQPRRFCPMSAFVRNIGVRGDVALVEAGSVLCGVDAATLTELWRTRTCPRGLYVDDQRPRYLQTPGLVLVWRAGRPRGTSTELALEALDVRTGVRRWRYEVGPLRKVPAFHVAGGAMLLMEGRDEEVPGNQHLACLELATGRRRWHRPDVSRLDTPRTSEGHLLLGYGPSPQAYSLATGAPVEWAHVPEAERAVLQKKLYHVGRVRCAVTELWSDAKERIVHVNARELGGGKLYFGRDVILRVRHGETVNPDKPEGAVWSFRPPKNENAARVVNSVSRDGSLIVALNPIQPAKKPSDRVHCLDQATGRIRWRFSTAEAVGPCVLLGGALAFADGKAVRALDVASGRKLWAHEMPGAVRHGPVAVGTAAVFGDEGGLTALDVTGRVLWRRRLAGGLRATPAVLGARLLAASAGLSLLDGATGEPVAPMREVASSAVGAAHPVADEHSVYVLTRSGRIHAVDGESLALRWRTDGLPPAGDRFSSPGSLARGGRVVCAASGQQLVALEREKGTPLWRKSFERAVAGLACSGKRVFALADKAYAFDATGGAPLWQFKQQHGFSRYLWYFGNMNPLARDGRVYFTDWFVLYCLDAAPGEKLWATRVAEGKHDRVFCMPTRDGTRLLYTSRDHGLYSVDLASGERRRLLRHAPCLGGHDAYGVVGRELYYPTSYLHLVRVLSAGDGAELAAIQLNDRAISPLVSVGNELLLGGQRSLIALDPRRRSVSRAIATGHPASHVLPSRGALLVVDQGLKEYATAPPARR